MKGLAPSACLLASLCALVCSSSACATVAPSCKVPDTVELELESSDRVNRDDKGRSLPTVVRLLQLTELSALQSASFDDINENADATLKESKVGAPTELTIYPGQIMVERFKRNPAADFLVAVAVFRQPAGGAWRTVEEWPLAGDPCAEQDDEDAAPKLKQLRIRAFLRDYRIESTNNYARLPKRTCPPGATSCRGASGSAPDELPEELRNRRLRTFDEDESAPTPTVGEGAHDPDAPDGPDGAPKETN